MNQLKPRTNDNKFNFNNKYNSKYDSKYNVPQIRLKRSGQFGGGLKSSCSVDDVPAYATLPRNRVSHGSSLLARSNTRSQSLVPNTPQHHQARTFTPQQPPSSSMNNIHLQSTTQAVSPSRLRPQRVPPMRSPGEHRHKMKSVRPSLVQDQDEYQPVSISTIPRRNLNTVHRITKEEILAKRQAKLALKQQYFENTPPNKIKFTQKDLQVYAAFYEKKLAELVENLALNIALEKRKKDRMEAKLKFLLADNDSLAMELAGIKRDLKKCQHLTETPV